MTINLLEPEILTEVTIIWPSQGVPRMWVSKGEMTREEVVKVVTDLIGLAVEFGASYGVHVSGTIKKPEKS